MAGAFIEIQGDQGAQKIQLGQQPLTVGRHPTNVLVVNDGQASRFHCVIEKVAEGFRVRDLDSRNGTKLNGTPIKTALILDGDVVTIGTLEIKFVVPPERTPRRDGRAASVDLDMEELATRADPEVALQTMADSLPDKSFGEHEIAIINARGQVVHGAREESQKKQIEGKEAINLFRTLLLVCFRLRATDVHVEPKSNDCLVRLRVDGSMLDVARLNKEMATRLLSAIKILCDIDIAHKNIVQEGHFSIVLPDRQVDCRVSFAPVMFGQKLVIRILDQANAPRYIWDLQLPEQMFKTLEAAVQLDSGMVLVCGPTGSGKTSTLYAVVRSMDVGQRNVVTIEDPVEIQLEGITQIPVNDEQGNTFAALLRSVLRQDPDAIMVGEIRDAETARTAMQAAMTGHLVFSTVHARDTVGTVFRLLDLGIEPFLVSSGLYLVLAQRLVRQLCPYCKVPTKITPEQKTRMGQQYSALETIYTSRGCRRCLKTGFAGRRAIFELLTNNNDLKEALLKSPTPADIFKALGTTQFVRLMQSGYQLVAEGITTLDEVERSVGMT
ncbi:MAG TPA: ATPase, T2SS/T4P/T4SS family [Tepidisphaeraceae bacterium]|nr:ATPase, T2SS/T4P/T4SS family [Tepidisphaeraceae bacterium]